MNKDYKKLYKQALERAKYLKENTDSIGAKDISYTFEQIFPELKESEDERIRKEILELVSISGNGNQFEEIKDWLEKQGEQKLIIIIPKFKVGDIIKPKPYNEEHLIKDINENGYVLDVDIIIPFKNEDVWEIVEQKLAWSEKDEKMYQSILDDTVQNYLLDGNQFAWLKSIKDRVQPQPKQEWSEEDELMLTSIIQTLKLTNGAAQMKIDWLKSIKPNHWKPSEEQLEALWNAIPHIPNSEKDIDTITELSVLYEELKKL